MPQQILQQKNAGQESGFNMRALALKKGTYQSAGA
jgi:hypothetical protein